MTKVMIPVFLGFLLANQAMATSFTCRLEPNHSGCATRGSGTMCLDNVSYLGEVESYLAGESKDNGRVRMDEEPDGNKGGGVTFSVAGYVWKQSSNLREEGTGGNALKSGFGPFTSIHAQGVVIPVTKVLGKFEFDSDRNQNLKCRLKVLAENQQREVIAEEALEKTGDECNEVSLRLNFQDASVLEAFKAKGFGTINAKAKGSATLTCKKD